MQVVHLGPESHRHDLGVFPSASEQEAYDVFLSPYYDATFDHLAKVLSGRLLLYGITILPFVMGRLWEDSAKLCVCPMPH